MISRTYFMKMKMRDEKGYTKKRRKKTIEWQKISSLKRFRIGE